MEAIRTLEGLVDHVRTLKGAKRLAVAFGQDPNTIGAVSRAVKEGFVQAFLIGHEEKIVETCQQERVDPKLFTLVHAENEVAAAKEAVRMAREDEADIVMKGLVDTSKFLGAVMDKERGLLPPGEVMTYVCAIQVPQYPKLLFVSDTAVIPVPDLKQKKAMVRYAVAMAHRFGISLPKVALLGAAEKVSPQFPSTLDDAQISKMYQRGQLKGAIVDGPLDLFCACDKKGLAIKGVRTPVEGEADVLIFPSLEASNTFYKGLMLFGGGELAGLIQGTTKPVVVMSRSESPESKFYCLSLARLMAEETLS